MRLANEAVSRVAECGRVVRWRTSDLRSVEGLGQDQVAGIWQEYLRVLASNEQCGLVIVVAAIEIHRNK